MDPATGKGEDLNGAVQRCLFQAKEIWGGEKPTGHVSTNISPHLEGILEVSPLDGPHRSFPASLSRSAEGEIWLHRIKTKQQ